MLNVSPSLHWPKFALITGIIRHALLKSHGYSVAVGHEN
jgi:hypothetical protein